MVMSEDQRLCPTCARPMIETPVKLEPEADPRFAHQPLDEAESAVLVMRLECPECHHVEGRHPKGVQKGL
jgi:hypothetical protein